MWWLGWWKRQSSRKSWLLVLLGLAFLIMFPSLGDGLVIDDILHRNVFAGATAFDKDTGSPLMSMFRFFPAEPKIQRRMRDAGQLPWWTSPRFTGTFWRPVSAATHALDYGLWPGSPWLMHVHSLLWYLFVLLLALLLYRVFLPEQWIVHTALWLFALHEAFAFPVTWLANRNALVGLVMGFLCLLSHHQWRATGRKSFAFLALFWMVLGLLSSESMLAITSYLLGYALFLDREDNLLRRLMTLVHYAVVVVLWRLLYSSLGYGMKGSGTYVDPLLEPVTFWTGVVQKLPVMLLGEWAAPSPEPFMMLKGPMLWGYIALGVLFSLFLLRALWPILHRPVVRFFGTGMLLSLVPVAATTPQARTLLFSAFGGMALMALLLQHIAQKSKGSLASGQRWVFRGVLFCATLHLFLSPLALFGNTRFKTIVPRLSKLQLAGTALPKGHNVETMVLINSPFHLLDVLMFESRLWHRQPTPRFYRVLAPAHGPVTVFCKDRHTLVVSTRTTFVEGIGQLFRGPQDPLKAGDIIRLPDMTVYVLKADRRGMPTKVSFRFQKPLNSPQLRLLKTSGKGYTRFVPPPIGKEVVLPAFPFQSLLLSK